MLNKQLEASKKYCLEKSKTFSRNSTELNFNRYSMKKRIIIPLVLLLGSFFSDLKAQDYLEIITEQVCECVDKLSSDLSKDGYTMQAGICMIQAAEPYSKKLKKDHGIDLSEADEEGEALGRLLGLKMLTTCPEVIMRLAELVDDTEEAVEEEYEYLYASGLITELVEEPFVVFTLREKTGKVVKMYWLTFVESEFAIMSKYATLLGRKVGIEYSEVEVYDSRLKEYRNINIIESLILN